MEITAYEETQLSIKKKNIINKTITATRRSKDRMKRTSTLHLLLPEKYYLFFSRYYSMNKNIIVYNMKIEVIMEY